MKNEPYKWTLLHLVLIVIDVKFSDLYVLRSSKNCPDWCHCKQLDTSLSSLTVTCKGLNLKFVPILNSSVESLDLSFNPLMELSNGEFKTYKNLKFLYVLRCNLSQIEANSFEGLSRVLFINLALNSLTYINPMTFHALKNLETLIISKNPLKIISGPFLYSNNIKMLDISKCAIRSVTSDAFYYLPGLEIINLRGNVLNTLSNDTFQNLNKLNYVELRNNLWFCTCEVKDLFVRLSSESILINAHVRRSSDTCVDDVYAYEGTIFCVKNSKKVPLWSDCHSDLQCEEKDKTSGELYVSQWTTIQSSSTKETLEKTLRITTSMTTYKSVTDDSSGQYYTTEKISVTDDSPGQNYTTENSVSSNVTTSIFTTTENLNSIKTETYFRSSYSKLHSTMAFLTTTDVLLKLNLTKQDISKNSDSSKTTSNILLISLIVALMCLMFVLGILVGIKCILRNRTDIDTHDTGTPQNNSNERICKCLSCCRNARITHVLLKRSQMNEAHSDEHIYMEPMNVKT